MALSPASPYVVYTLCARELFPSKRRSLKKNQCVLTFVMVLWRGAAFLDVILLCVTVPINDSRSSVTSRERLVQKPYEYSKAGILVQ